MTCWVFGILRLALATSNYIYYSMKKLILTILILVILGLAGWWYANGQPPLSSLFGQSSNTTPVQAPAPLQVTSNATATPTTPGTPNTVVIPLTGSSDAALDQYTGNVDTQMSGLTTDTANADAGLSAQ
jgi:hypothetical protein